MNQSLPSNSQQLYDGIILRHVIEHLLNPRELLLKIKNLLKPNGKLYIEVPGLLDILNGKYEFDLKSYFVK